MKRYYYPVIRNGSGYINVNDKKEFVYWDYIEDTDDISKLWAYCRKLASNYARKNNAKAVYTTHPDNKRQAVWAVVTKGVNYKGYIIETIQTKLDGWYAEYIGNEEGQTFFYDTEEQAVKQAKSLIDCIERTRI